MREVRLLRVKSSTRHRRQWIAEVVLLGRQRELVVVVTVESTAKLEVERIAG